jgi:5-deoxy-glucuronate isomerase
MSGKQWHRGAGSLAAGPWSLELTPGEAGWTWSSLRVLELFPGGSCAFGTGKDEVLVLPLSGSCTVECEDQQYTLAGRTGVLSGEVTDFAYVPMGSAAKLTSPGGGRFALPGARATQRLPFRYQAGAGVPVEFRGAGSCSRRVTNFCTPEAFDADRLIACEVLTPAGNWSSYPPHKHDEERPGETALEEIYYFEVAVGPTGPGVAYQRVYGTAERPVDVLAEVRTGDVVVIPHGWHGPSMAAPGYDLYYLNVMAGPGPRAWLICDDPAHAWVRGTWAHQDVDPRLLAFGLTP